MGLKIRKNGHGYRPWWYGVYKEGGKTKSIKLCVRIDGTPPADLSLKSTGDTRFEQSRAAAQKEFNLFMEQRERKGTDEHLLERLIESKTGQSPKYVRLGELAELWNGIPRTKELSEGRQKQNIHMADEFATFCGRTYLYEVTQEDVTKYFNSIRTSFTWSSVSSRMGFLSGAFEKFLPHGLQNPFKSTLVGNAPQESKLIGKTPLSTDEIAKVRDRAKPDPLLNYLFEGALATGARIKDVCMLKWENVNLAKGLVSYRSSKTGQECEVPLFAEFRAVLEGLLANRRDEDPRICPEAAEMYEHNRSGVEYRGKKLFAEALFSNIKKQESPTDIIDGKPVPSKTPLEVIALLDEQRFASRKMSRIKDVYTRYVIYRQSNRQIARETGIPKSSVSGYLDEIERLCGEKIARFDKLRIPKRRLFAFTREKRTTGRLSASKYGWHSLRTTFCVQAMLHGVPSEAIIKAVGHSTYKTTSRYYMKLTGEMIRDLWQGKDPTTSIGCTTPVASAQPTMAALVSSLSPTDRQQLIRELLRQTA